MNKSKKIRKNIWPKTLQIASLYFSVFFVVFAIIFFIFFINHRNDTIERFKFSTKNQLQHQKNIVLSNFDMIRSDLLFLPMLNEIIAYNKNQNPENLKLIEKEFFEFIRVKELYDQIRYLDNTGMEKCRVNRIGNNVYLEEKDKLQNKGNRYYFKEAIEFNKNEVYISPFDLNIEGKIIESPIKPVIRFATPVKDSNGQLKGLVILNYLGSKIIRLLKKASINYYGYFSLVNQDGYWLSHNNTDYEWAFMYPDKKNLNYPTIDSVTWGKISGTPEYQGLTDTALVTSSIVIPYPEIQQRCKNAKWYLVSTISYKEMGIEISQVFNQFRSLIAIFILFLLFISLIIARTIVIRRLQKEELIKAALFDNLTNLPNRKSIMDRITQSFEYAKRYETSFALFFLDLDGFKKINDTIGHDAGDELLIQASKRMTKCIRESDTVARFGGDEFVILLSKINKIEDCSIVANSVIKEISKPFVLKNKTTYIGVSIGITTYQNNSKDSVEQLLVKADDAMYEVKRSGKNNFKIV